MVKKFLFSLATLGVLFVTPVSAQAATVSFNPASGSLNKGCEVSIKVDLDTQGIQTDGTDVIVLYNPAQLSISTSSITNGTIYPEYPGNSVDSSSGKVSISGISSVSSPFSGNGTFATLKFRVADSVAAGAAVSLKFDFDPNNKTKTTDTNVVERGTIADVLSSVTDGSYTVGTGTCTGSVGNTLTSTGGGQGQALPGSGAGASQSAYQVYQPTLNDVTGGPAGLLDNTLLVAAVGGVLLILGIAGLAML